MRFLKQIQIELPYNPAIPFWNVYPEKTLTQKDIFTPMFIAELFTTVKPWKQPKCPSTDEWIKMWWVCVYTIFHYIFILLS